MRPWPLSAVALTALALWAPPVGRAADFLPATGYPTAPGAGSSVALGNFNGDAYQDLAITNNNDRPFEDPEPGTVSVLLGEAGGRFAAPAAHPVGREPASVAVADFNGDADLDLAVANRWSDSISVLLGQAGAGFADQTVYPVGHFPHSLATGDFNADGQLDLATTAVGSYYGAPGTIWVLLGRAGGTFETHAAFPAGSQPESVAVGDFNADGDPDLVVANYVSSNISILLGEAGAGFGAPTALTVGNNPGSVAVGHFNGDGDPDLAVANVHDVPPFDYSNVSRVAVLLGADGSSFVMQNKYRVGIYPNAVAVADFNNDADPDLAVTHSGTSFDSGPQVSVLLGKIGGGGFESPSAYPAPAYSVGAGELNGDTYDDLAVGGPSSVSVLLREGAVSLNPWRLAWQARPDSTQGSRRTTTLTNRSGGDLVIDHAALAGPDATSFRLPAATDECTGTTLAAAQTCTVTARFRPDGVGLKTARIEFTDDAPGSPQFVSLSGTGTPGPWLTLSPQALKFGHVPVGASTATKTVTLTNTGSADMSIIGFAVGGANPGDFVGLSETCTALPVLGPDESCSAEVAFRPTATGSRAATLTIGHTAPRSPHRVQLYGTGN